MARLGKLYRRMEMSIHRRRLSRELEEEMAFHVDCVEAALRQSGVPGEVAGYAARRRFGNRLRMRELSVESWGWGWAESLAQDLRFGVRMLLRKPVFSLVVIAVLALGIGLNAALFSMVEAVLLRPLPYRDPGRLTIVWQSSPQHRATGEWFNTYRHFEEWQRRSQSFTTLAALSWATKSQTAEWRGRRQSVLAIPVSAEFFSMLGVQAQYGRVFQPRDATSGCAVVLAHAYWQEKLGADPRIAGQPLIVNGTACQVVGVMPEQFSFYPLQTNLWTVITPDSPFVREPWSSPTGVLGRLRPGVSRASAQQELAAIEASISAEAPAQLALPPETPVVLDLQAELTWLAGRNLRQGLLLLSAAVALVLLIACLNVANLLLGRAVERQREMAIRASIGCGRARMVRQLLTESLLLASCGAAAGVCLAMLVLHIFRAVHPVELPPGNGVEMRWHVLLFVAALTMVCALLCGVAPAWRASRTELAASLKNDARAGRAMPQRTTKTLVVLQVAVSLVLLSGAMLLIKSLTRLTATPLGYRTDHLLTADVDLAVRPGTNEAAQEQLAEGLLRRLSALPGVRGAALTSVLQPVGTEVLAVAGKALNRRTAEHDVASQSVSASYFQTAEIPLLAGRGFAVSDREQTQAVAIVNARLAQQYFPAGDAVGRQIKLSSPEDLSTPWLTVVGVVGDVKSTSVFQEMGYVTRPAVYRPMTQTPGSAHTLTMRTEADPLSMAEPLQRAASSVDRDLMVAHAKTMQAVLQEQSAQPRFRTVLLGGFAGMALLLAALGIYGLLAQQVVQRTLEIGIRMALGADRLDIVQRIVRQALTMTAVGAVLGVAGSLAAAKLLTGLLYQTSANDPWLLCSAIAVFACVALAASLLPAWRASRVEPMVSMRAE